MSSTDKGKVYKINWDKRVAGRGMEIEPSEPKVVSA
jgi:hypothetical protein